MAQVLIYTPTKSATQSGRAHTLFWHIEPLDGYENYHDPLMGWFGSHGTFNQVRMRFPSKEAAIAFARRQEWEYEVLESEEKNIRPKSYAENFR